MTVYGALSDHPHPAAALERRFGAILRGPMRDVPLVNPALRVQAVGFAPHGDDWLGVLVTPWFMSLLVLPRVAAAWRPLPVRESRHLVFPAGVFAFIGADDAELGNYLACSLASPMFDFADDASARDTAAAALQALFDPRVGVDDEPALSPGRSGAAFEPVMAATPAAAAVEPAVAGTPTPPELQRAVAATPAPAAFQPAMAATPAAEAFRPAVAPTPAAAAFQPALVPTSVAAALKPVVAGVSRPTASDEPAPSPAPAVVSKRAFLFGAPRQRHGHGG